MTNLLPSRRSSLVKSDNACPTIQHSSLCLYTRSLHHYIRSCALLTVWPNCIMRRNPTILQGISHQGTGGRSERTQEPCRISLNHLHIHSTHFYLSHIVTQPAPSALSYPRLPSRQPSNLTSDYPVPAVISTTNAFLAVWTHPCSPHLQIISILDDPHCSLIHSWYSDQTSQTLQLCFCIVF